MIQLENAVKVYKHYNMTKIALNHVNVSINQGEMVAIMGPSGSGKSTMLNILGGMDRLSEGIYRYHNEIVSDYGKKDLQRFRKQNVGFIFQNFALINRLTVYENMEIPLLARNEKKYHKRIMECMEALNIAELAKMRPAQISGGQQQRCAIGRALMTNCNLLLCDEPTGALDYESGQEVMDILNGLNKKGMTIILVTHDIKIAEKCRRTINIFNGEVR